MKKTIFSENNSHFLKLLKEVRDRARLTQGELADKLGTTQSFISKCERGERRLDIVELDSWCLALKTSLSEFVMQYEAASKVIKTGRGRK